jgi:hypothetical protein
MFIKKNNQIESKATLYINPRQFWNWLLQKDNYTYSDLVTICCKLGTSYNCYKTKYQLNTIQEIRTYFNKNNSIYDNTHKDLINELNDIYDNWNEKIKTINEKNLLGLVQLISAMELYNQVDKFETEFHYINSERSLNKSKIHFRYFDIFSELLLSSQTISDSNSSEEFV